jgi:hypothetical protein
MVPVTSNNDFCLLFQNELLNGHGTQYLEKDLTEDRVEKADQVCVLFYQI